MRTPLRLLVLATLYSLAAGCTLLSLGVETGQYEQQERPPVPAPRPQKPPRIVNHNKDWTACVWELPDRSLVFGNCQPPSGEIGCGG